MGARKLTIRYFNKEREKDYVVLCLSGLGILADTSVDKIVPKT